MSGGDKNCREEIRQRRVGSWFSAVIRECFTDGGDILQRLERGEGARYGDAGESCPAEHPREPL